MLPRSSAAGQYWIVKNTQIQESGNEIRAVFGSVEKDEVDTSETGRIRMTVLGAAILVLMLLVYFLFIRRRT